MTDSSKKHFDSLFLESIEVAEANEIRKHIEVRELEIVHEVGSNYGKNDIKVSEGGVAKLTFGFLDDMQGGDSSLEPGEVKTPPPGSSPSMLKEPTPSALSVDKPQPPFKQLAKALKTVSQLEAEACEEKVRAILELDAKRRKEDVEKRKLEAEKRRQLGETDLELESKRKAKEERKQLKKLKKAKKAAEIALTILDENDKDESQHKKRKIKKSSESEESEGLCSSGADDGAVTTTAEKHSSILNSAVAIPSLPPLRYPPHLPPHLLPDAFMGGFRALNPFMRGPRPDFSHVRGSFMPRGRGGLRGRLPFPGFRPPFFPNSAVGGGQLKFNASLGPHAIQQQRQHHTPPPNRGHSPILPPSSDLQWTKCKPSLSYAFKINNQEKLQTHPDIKSQKQSIAQAEEDWDEDNSEAGEQQQQGDQQKIQHEQIRKKDKKHKSVTKEKKKYKKQNEKDKKKSKRNRLALQTSTITSIKQKKKSNKSSRRKIEKIRKSYNLSNRATPTQQQQHQQSSEETETQEILQNKRNDQIDQELNKSGTEKMPDDEEIRNKVENIKREKIEITKLKIEDLKLKVKPLIIVKTEPQEKENEKNNENQQITKNEAKKAFDILVESSPLPNSSAVEVKLNENPLDEDTAALGSVTPPLPPLTEHKGKRFSSLQNALEIQKRIDKLLQQDDIKLEAIEAAKDLLMKKTQKYQSAKEKLVPEQELNKASEQKSSEDAKPASHNEKGSSSREKPKAYKVKESSRKYKDDDKEKEKYRNSLKRKEDKDSQFTDTKSSSKSTDKSKEVHKNDKKITNYENNRDKSRNSEKDDEKEKSKKGITKTAYRNPFKRSISRDKFFGKIDSRRTSTRTKSRERDISTKRRLSNDRKRGDSSGYSSTRVSSKRRFSGSSANSTLFNRSKSGDRDGKGSLVDASSTKDKDCKDRKREKTPESRQKRKHSTSPKRKSEKVKETSVKNRQSDKEPKVELKSVTPTPKLIKIDNRPHENTQSKDNKKLKTPVKAVAKKRPLSFTQTEFLFPEEGNQDDFILGDDEETNDTFKNFKSPSDKEDSPDTDDYMDNWENDEDVDLDMNSNMPTDVSTPQKSLTLLTEEDSFVSRFANPSPPKELLAIQDETKTEANDDLENDVTQRLTPPLNLLKKLPMSSEPRDTQKQENYSPTKQPEEAKKPELFGMQELYDQFIKSVEASGVSMKTENKEENKELEKSHQKTSDNLKEVVNETQNQCEDPLSTSSTSTSSSNSSTSSSSSESNSSSNSSSSSSDSSSEDDSNDGEDFAIKQSSKKIKAEQSLSPKGCLISEKTSSNSTENIATKSTNTPAVEIAEREPKTPSPLPLQKSLLNCKTPTTPSSQGKTTPRSDVSKDFKKLKSLEANLSRIQLMRANYDSNDEISEELQKMELLFLQEKKIILQKYAKNTQTVKTATVATTSEFVPALPSNEFGIPPPPPPPEEPNKIFDANREAIKLTISPLKLSSKPAIFNLSLNEETEKKVTDDKDEIDFTDKLVKPAKEVAIVKPMMETKESKESRTRDSHRHRRSPGYGGSRERHRSPSYYRDRNRRSSSRNRFSPQRRGRGRSLSISPPRRGFSTRHGTPPRRVAPSSRFRSVNRRSRSRSRSPLRLFGNRRGKETSPFRRKRGQLQDLQSQSKKFGRHRNSRSRSPQTRPRSPRTPPPRRRSYSQDPYSRSPLPFKPPSPPMRRSLSPMDSPGSAARRSRSPPSPRRPRSPRSPRSSRSPRSPRSTRSPRSPRSPISPRSPLSPRSPRSPDSPPSHRYDDHRYRRDNSFERQSSISPHTQYYTPDSLAAAVPTQASSYYYNVSPNRISLDARINIVLNTPSGGTDTPPVSYEGYTNYAQYGGAAYMSIPPQPMANPPNSMSYYPNPYVPIMPSTHEGHHSILPSHATPQLHHHQAPAFSAIPTINSGITDTSSPLPPHNFYYNDFHVAHQPINPVLKELPKAPVAVQKGNVLEILPSNVESTQSTQIGNKLNSSPVLVETIKNHINKIASISWKDEVNNRHVKSAVMRLNRGAESSMRSILKRSEAPEKQETTEKKKVYFEDGIYPSRDSDDEDRKLIEYKIRKKVLRLRKKRGIDVPAARDLLDSKVKPQKPKIDAALEKLPPPPPPNTMPSTNFEQPIYLRPPTPVPLVYFHFDSVVHSMYVSQLEKPIPPRLLNPKCVPPGAATTSSASGSAVGGGSTSTTANSSPNPNLPSASSATKKELTSLAALNRVGRNESATSSPKTLSDVKRESPNSQQSPITVISQPSGMHFTPTQTSPQMSPMHGPVIRHPPSPIGFVGMRLNNFMRLPPSPLALARATVPPRMQAPPPHIINLPTGMMGIRHHPHYNIPPPNLMPPVMLPDANYNPVACGSPYGPIQTPPPPPGFQGYGQRPKNPGFFMGPASHAMQHMPPPIPVNSQAKEKDHKLLHQQKLHHQHHHPPHPQQHSHLHLQHQQHHHIPHKPPPPLPPPPIANSVVVASPQAMIAPFNVKKTVN